MKIQWMLINSAFAQVARSSAESAQVLQNYAAIMRIQHLEKKLVATAKPPVRVNVSTEDRIELLGPGSRLSLAAFDLESCAVIVRKACRFAKASSFP